MSNKPGSLDLERDFSAVDNGKPRSHNECPDEQFEVIDAECETVAYCPSMEHAELVAAALNLAFIEWGY